jgi:hypothetical protein
VDGFNTILNALYRQRAAIVGTDLPAGEPFVYRPAKAPPRFVAGIVERNQGCAAVPLRVRLVAAAPIGISPAGIELGDDVLEVPSFSANGGRGPPTVFRIARIVALEQGQIVLELK